MLPFRFSHRALNPRVTLWEMEGTPEALYWAAMFEEASRFLKDLEQRGKSTAVIVDSSDLTPIDAGMRKTAGQWRAENMALIANVVPCASYVAQRAWMRGALTAIFWFASPTIPVGVRASRDEALIWTEQHLNARVSL